MLKTLLVNKDKRKAAQEVLEVVIAVWTISAFIYKKIKKED